MEYIEARPGRLSNNIFFDLSQILIYMIDKIYFIRPPAAYA